MLNFIVRSSDIILPLQVFDTDVNPTTAMNVEDIKKLFKNNYMDPKVSTVPAYKKNDSMSYNITFIHEKLGSCC